MNLSQLFSMSVPHTSKYLYTATPVCPYNAVVPWNDDSILVVLKLEIERILLGVLSVRNACASLRLLNVLNEFEVHI